MRQLAKPGTTSAAHARTHAASGSASVRDPTREASVPPMVLPVFQPASATVADPFGEHVVCGLALQRTVLGGRFHFCSDSEPLLGLVEAAYGGLAPGELPGARDFHVELRLLPARAKKRDEPPPVCQSAGAGLLCGVMDESNYVVLDPQGCRALVVASQDMLAHAYHLRYELIEFAVFTLATRGMGLVPLHGACLGHAGRGVLLLGESGAGKSTLALHGLLHGLDFLAEDAVFVQPDRLLATGVPNFLHVRPDALGLLAQSHVRQWLARSPRITRRSGVAKIEADLRQGVGRLAGGPLELVGAVRVSPERAAAGEELSGPLAAGEAAAWLAANQPYAANQPGWHAFVQALVQRGVYVLRRGRDPQASVDALRRLLDRRDAPGETESPSRQTASGRTTFPRSACTQER